jgi:hypothetical protein
MRPPHSLVDFGWRLFDIWQASGGPKNLLTSAISSKSGVERFLCHPLVQERQSISDTQAEYHVEPHFPFQREDSALCWVHENGD